MLLHTWGKSFKTSMDDINKVMVRKARFIIISEIQSQTIPDIFNLIFNIFNRNQFDGSIKTKIFVVNVSETIGSIHSQHDRLRSIITHTGTADCSPDEITNDTIIRFDKVDYNCFTNDMRSRDEETISLEAIKLSYDKDADPVTRNSHSHKYKDIIIPTPNFYEEYDMVKLTGNEVSHLNTCNDLDISRLENNPQEWLDNVFRIKFGELIDSQTTVRKIQYNIEQIGPKYDISPLGLGASMFPRESNCLESIDTDEIHRIACSIKYLLEQHCFSGVTVIFTNRNGFNVDNLKSYMRLNKFETKMNYKYFIEEIEKLYHDYRDVFPNMDSMVDIRHDKVSVKVFDSSYTIDVGINRSDYLTDEMSDSITFEHVQSNYGFPKPF